MTPTPLQSTVLATKPDKTDIQFNSEKKEQERTIKNKAKFLKLMREKTANITVTCESVGISRETYYEWRRLDPDFRKETNAILESEQTYVEDKLRKLIDKDVPSAIYFYLGRRHPKYKNKLKVESYTPEQSFEDLIDEEDNATGNTPNNIRDAEYTEPDKDNGAEG